MSAIVLERWENPGGLGNRTSTITISTTLAVSGSISALIDGAYGQNYTDSVEITGGQSSKEIKFDFGSGNAKKITAFVWWKDPIQSQGTWKLAGSNDDITYLDVCPAITISALYSKGVSNGVNDGYYRYYKLIQTSGTTSSTPWNIEIEFKLSDSGTADVRSVSAPSYSNFLGTGNRLAYIILGGTIIWASNQESIINGLIDNSSYMSNGQTGKYIEFDFTEDVLITEFLWKQDNSASQGSWKWQGDSGGGAYVDLTSSFTLGGATVTTVTALSGITAYYSKYRLTQVSGSTSSSPYITEIEFKVGQPAIVSASVPTISTVAPTSGTSSGGTPVTITGTLLTGTTDVKFDSTSATSIVVVDDSHITCVTPSHIADIVDVTVYTPSGNITATDAFIYADVQARTSQVPILVLDISSEPSRVTQVPVLVLYQEKQPNRVTQAPTLVLYQPKPVPLPAPIIPETPLFENWGWKTVLNASHVGQEQRSRLRNSPRITLQISVLILNEEDRVNVYNMLMRYLKTPFSYPLYQYCNQLSQAAVIGETKIYCNTSYTDIRDGEVVALVDPKLDQTVYLTCTTVDSDGINLSTALEFNVPANWQICPTILFRIMPVVGLNMSNIAGDLSLVMESLVPRIFQRPGAAPTLTTIDSILIVPERHLANSDIKENFNHGVEWFDNGTSVPEILNEWSNPHVEGNRQYKFDRRTQIDYWRAICDELKGRQGVALFPTFRNDLKLREPMSLGSTTFTTNNINFLKWWLDINYRYLAIFTANGTIYRRIIDVSPHYDSNGDPDYLTVQLSVAIGSSTGDNAISIISYMNLCRLDTDDIKLTHIELDTLIDFTIKAIDR